MGTSPTPKDEEHVELAWFVSVRCLSADVLQLQPERHHARRLCLDCPDHSWLRAVRIGQPSGRKRLQADFLRCHDFPSFTPWSTLPRMAATSSVMSMATGHQVMHRPQPTQPETPY